MKIWMYIKPFVHYHVSITMCYSCHLFAWHGVDFVRRIILMSKLKQKENMRNDIQYGNYISILIASKYSVHMNL